jgi:3-oxoacyl-[acyl-carrier protein] reductase
MWFQKKEKMKYQLEGKRALVAGSTQGIGWSSALALAEEGVSVTLLARNKEALLKCLGELPVVASAQHGFLVADFNDPSALKEILAEHLQSGLVYHILVNNTGGPAGGPIVQAGIDEFRNTFNQHLICNHLLTTALVPLMKKEGFGRIINIISTSVKQPLKGLGVSNTIRAAVANWSKTLSVELAPFGITVNNVLPGATATGRLSGLIEAKALKTGKTINEMEQEMLHEIPAGRFAQPWEVAAAVAFLASGLAGYINGINVPVDGGRTSCL